MLKTKMLCVIANDQHVSIVITVNICEWLGQCVTVLEGDVTRTDPKQLSPLITIRVAEKG